MHKSFKKQLTVFNCPLKSSALHCQLLQEPLLAEESHVKVTLSTPRATGGRSSVTEVPCQALEERKVPEHFRSHDCPGTAAILHGLQVLPKVEIIFLQVKNGHVSHSEVFLQHDFLLDWLQMIHLPLEFHKEVLNDGLRPASAGEVPGENTEDLLEHLIDDQYSIFLPELLCLPYLLRDLEVHPDLEAMLRS